MKLIKNIAGRIFALWALMLFIVTMGIFFIPYMCIFLVPEPRRSYAFMNISRLWMLIFLPGIGCPLTITGRHHFKKGENYIVLCNHNSMMDVPVSSPGIPGANKTIAKIEMASTPVFGILYRMGTVLVDRKSEASRRESMIKMKEVLDMGIHICIYPEGTRNKTEQPLKPFHNGAFRLALDSGKAIIPALIYHTRKVMPSNKTFFLRPHPLKMEFLEPIKPRDGETPEELNQRVFTVMNNLLRQA